MPSRLRVWRVVAFLLAADFSTANSAKRISSAAIICTVADTGSAIAGFGAGGVAASKSGRASHVMASFNALLTASGKARRSLMRCLFGGSWNKSRYARPCAPFCDTAGRNSCLCKACCAQGGLLLVARSYLSGRVRPWRNW